MPGTPPPEGVHIVGAARYNAMLGVCEAARIWIRSTGEDKSRAERGLLRAVSQYETMPARDEEE